MTTQNKITSVTEALEKAERTLFLSGWDWVKSKALTEYAKYIENKAREEGKQFWIVSAGVYKVQKVVYDKWNDRVPTGEIENLISGTFGNFIGFVYGDEYFYIQLDDNPFFNDGGIYHRIVINDRSISRDYYADSLNIGFTYDVDNWQEVLEALKQFDYKQSRPYSTKNARFQNIDETSIYIY